MSHSLHHAAGPSIERLESCNLITMDLSGPMSEYMHVNSSCIMHAQAQCCRGVLPGFIAARVLSEPAREAPAGAPLYALHLSRASLRNGELIEMICGRRLKPVGSLCKRFRPSRTHNRCTACFPE